MTVDYKTVIADEGKTLVRIKDGIKVGKQIELGYTYYMYNTLLNEPLLEKFEDYMEVDEELSSKEGIYTEFEELNEE